MFLTISKIKTIKNTKSTAKKNDRLKTLFIVIKENQDIKSINLSSAGEEEKEEKEDADAGVIRTARK